MQILRELLLEDKCEVTTIDLSYWKLKGNQTQAILTALLLKLVREDGKAQDFH